MKVDEARWCFPMLPELCGTYWPQPWSDETEIAELERLYQL
jgi:hypothetical protein